MSEQVGREVIVRAIRGLGGFVPGDRVWVMLWGEPTETRVSQVEGDVVHTGVGSFRRSRVIREMEMVTEARLETCPFCRGDGYLIANKFDAHMGMLIDCEACKRSGQIVVRRLVEVLW